MTPANFERRLASVGVASVEDAPSSFTVSAGKTSRDESPLFGWPASSTFLLSWSLSLIVVLPARIYSTALDRLYGQLRRQVAAAYAAIEQLELFRDRLIPRTEQTLEIAAADYQGEKADFTDLVGIYRELLAYQVQIARTKATLVSTLAQIDRTVGCEVDANIVP